MTSKVEAGETSYFANRQSDVELANGKVKETVSCNQQQGMATKFTLLCASRQAAVQHFPSTEAKWESCSLHLYCSYFVLLLLCPFPVHQAISRVPCHSFRHGTCKLCAVLPVNQECCWVSKTTSSYQVRETAAERVSTHLLQMGQYMLWSYLGLL